MDIKAILGEAEGGIGTLLAGELAPLLSAAAEDLKEYGLAIAKDGLQAVLRGDKVWQAQLKSQLKMLAEIQRIRVETVDWDLTEKIVSLVLRAGAAAVGGTVKGIVT